jgi:UMF1 family MFS transporter
MMLVNVDRGRSDAAALAKTLEELSRARVDDDDDNLSQEIRNDLRGSVSYQRS